MSKDYFRINIYLKYSFIFFSILLIILGIIRIIGSNHENKTLIAKDIEDYLRDYIESKKHILDNVVNKFESDYLNEIENRNNISFNNDFNNGLSIEGIDEKGELIYWYKINESYARIFLSKYKEGVNFANIQNNVYYFIVKNNKYKNDKYIFIYYLKLDKLNYDSSAHYFSSFLSNKLNRIVKVNFDDSNIKNKIFYNNQLSVRIEKTNINSYEDGNPYSVNNLFKTVLFIWVIFIYYLGTFYIRKSKSNFISSFFLLLFTVFWRYLIYFLDLANIYLLKPFSNPANYSSSIAYGILKSPIDLTISLLFCSFLIYNFVRRFQKLMIRNKYKRILLIIFSMLFSSYISYLFVRIIKSFFYDGNLKYFKLGDFYYDYVTYLMLFNALIIGILFIYLTLFLFSLILINLDYLENKFKMISICLVIITIYLFAEVLIGSRLSYSIIFLMIFLIITVYILSNSDFLLISKSTLIFSLFAGSLITNFLMGIMYTRTENDRLKLAAFELTRIDDNIIKFFIRESLIRAKLELDNKNLEDINDFKYEAYKLWNMSKIKSENLITEYYFLDSNKKYLGGVNFSFPYEYSKNWNDVEIDDFKIVIDTINSDKGTIISGISSVGNGRIYFGLNVQYNKFGYNFADVPTILNKISDNKIYFDDYRVFWINNDEITFQKADIDINRDELKELINSANGNDGFVTKSINSQRFLFYVIKENSSDRYLLIGYKTRDFSWNIYDFVKIFIVHFVFIIVLGLLVSFLRVFTSGFPSFNYQARLLSGILIITIIPLIILAVYFDDTIKDKLENSIRLNLMTQSDRTANFLESYGQNPELSFRDLIIKTNNDLDINFSLFSENEVKYSTYLDYYYLGGLSFYLDYNLYQSFKLNKINEIFVKNSLKNQTVYCYYTRINIKGQEYILEVNDSVNKYYMVFDTSEINLFLYGIYSFAIIIIVLMSILLTRRISKPILSLTKAAGEVANGNFDIYLKYKDKGDIGNLMQSFNLMVKELKRIKEELSIKEREAAWREMAKQVAHEIKNPLTPMKLSIQLLIQAYNDKSPKFDEIFKKVSVTIANQIETLKRIADEFSVVAKLPPLNIGLYNIVEQINDIAKLYSGNEISISINPQKEDILLNLDAEQFKRIIINLIKNSIEANATILIITIVEVNEYIRILIEDNGNGIEENNKNKIFEDKFTTKSEGTGIGLSIVKNILSAFNAKIELLESKKGKTIFEINFKR